MNKPFPLDTANEFVGRHIGPRAADTAAMLQQLGYDSLEALGASVIPDSIKDTSVLELTAGLGDAGIDDQTHSRVLGQRRCERMNVSGRHAELVERLEADDEEDEDDEE